MPVVPARTFETWLRSLDGDAFAAFVADLYDARERGVRARGDGAVVLADGRVLAPVAAAWRLGSPRVPDDADAVVAASPSPRLRRAADRRGLTLLGPSDLRDLALYGVDRGDAERLFSEYFDRSPVVAPTRADRSEGSDGDRTDGFEDAAVASVAAVVLAGLVVAAMLGPFGPGVAPAADDAARSGSGPLVVGASRPAVVGGGGDSDDHLFPPGIGPTGVVDAEALAEAHADAVAGRSYRLVVRQSGTDGGNGRVWRGVWQQAEVENPRHFRYTVTGYVGNATAGSATEAAETDSTGATTATDVTTATTATGSVTEATATNTTTEATATDEADSTAGSDSRAGVELVQYAAYADGELVYVMSDRREEAFYRYPVIVDEDGHGVFERRAAFAVERYLDAPRTNVTRESRTRYPFRVVATGTPDSVPGADRISDYRAEASVGSDGFVSRLAVSYDLRVGDDTREVSYRMEYASIGEVDLSQPVWYDRAVNATRPDAAGTPATGAADESGTGENRTATESAAGSTGTETGTTPPEADAPAENGTGTSPETPTANGTSEGTGTASGTPTEPKRPSAHRDAVRLPAGERSRGSALP